MTNLYSNLSARWENAHDLPAIAVPGETLVTYGGLDRLSAQFASRLVALGVEPGERVVAQIEKSAGAVALYLACLRLGAAFVPLNTAYTPHEVEYFLRDARPVVFVCTPEAFAGLCPIAMAADVAHVAMMSASQQIGLWQEASNTSPLAEIAPRREEDLAAIVYTSGTTGRSKGAMLSHGNLSSNALALHKLWGFVPGDVLLHALPIYHVHGLFVALHTAFLNASNILLHNRFEAAEIRNALPKASVLMGVPTFYARLLEAGITRVECAHMRLFVSGSAPLTAPAFAAWEERTGHKILERYGMTETGMIASNPLGGARIAGTVGYALPGVSARIADNEGRELPRGEIGVIEVRGPNVFNGYWHMPEKTAQEFRKDGFFITGDMGQMSADGRVTIVGRAKDVIIAGGFNIYPKEIEDVLDHVPGVAESAVIGVPHVEMGEGVVAVLAPTRAGEPVPVGVLQWALDENLARFKHPRKFIWLDTLPRNAMGKVEKAALRARYKDAYQ